LNYIERALEVRAIREGGYFKQARKQEDALLDDLGYERYLLEVLAQRELEASQSASPDEGASSEKMSVFGMPRSQFSSFEELAVIEEEVRKALGVLYIDENSEGERVIIYRPRVDDFMYMGRYFAGRALSAAYLAYGDSEREVSLLLVYEDVISFAWRQGEQFWSCLADIDEGCHLVFVDDDGFVKRRPTVDSPLAISFGKARGQIALATLIDERNPAAVVRYSDGSWHVFHVVVGREGNPVTLDWHFLPQSYQYIVGSNMPTEGE
jgi:hypothetical protein